MSNFKYNGNLALDLMSYQHDCRRVDNALDGIDASNNLIDTAHDMGSDAGDTMMGVVQQSVESFLRVAGVRLAGRTTYSMERYNGGLPSLEGLGEGIKNVFMSIYNAIKKSISWVFGLIKRLFTRSKDRDEKIEKLEDQAEEIKKAADEPPKAGEETPVRSGSWLKTVKVEKTDHLKFLVNSQGFIGHNQITAIAAEMKLVFSRQHEHVRQMLNMTKAKVTSEDNDILSYDVSDYICPLNETKNSRILSELKAPEGSKVHASLEFGRGVHVAMAVPTGRPEKYKDAIKWADGLMTAKVVIGEDFNLSKYQTLEGDYANGDKLLDNVRELNEAVKKHTSDLENMQKAKEEFVRSYEGLVKKHGVDLFSSSEKKNVRDLLMFQLKFFRKTMDEPALSYYGLSDGLVNAYVVLTTYVLHANQKAGTGAKMATPDDNKSED